MSFTCNRTKPPARLTTATAAALAIDAAALWLVLAPQNVSLWLGLAALGMHLAGVGLILASGRCKSSVDDIRYLSGLNALLVLFMPGLGPAGCLASMTAGRRLLRPRGLAHSFSGDTAVADQQALSAARPKGDVELGEELSIQPVVDILEGEDTALKRGAIQLLRRMGSREAVRLLKMSLSDKDSEVRFYAHTALSRLEEDHADRFAKASKELDENDPHSLIELATVQRRYADSGLPDDNIRIQAFKEARDNMLKALALPGGDTPGLRIMIGQVELNLDELEPALEQFEKAIESDGRNADAMLGLLEARFRQRNAQELMRLRKTMAQRIFETTDPEKLILLNLWAGRLEGRRSHA